MSSNVNDLSDTHMSTSGVDDDATQINASPSSKGKDKAKGPKDHDMEGEEEEEEEEAEMTTEEEEEDEGGMSTEEEESDDEGEDDFQEIDPRAIQGRRTRGIKVDYTSKEALAKAGLQESESDVEMKT